MSLNSEPTIRVRAADIIELGNEQMRNPRAEVGAVLAGEITGNIYRVRQLLSLGTGAQPDSHQFVMDRPLAVEATEQLRPTGHTFLGMAHTHGPHVDLRRPSRADQATAGQYPVCLLLKVDEDGGGRFEFFTKGRRNLAVEIIGLDGRTYRTQLGNGQSRSIPDSCWKMAA